MITYRVVENQVFLSHPCKVALVYLNGKYTGVRMHKRLDDGLYFLTRKVNYSVGTDSFFYDLIDGSLTTEKQTISKIINNWFNHPLYSSFWS